MEGVKVLRRRWPLLLLGFLAAALYAGTILFWGNDRENWQRQTNCTRLANQWKATGAREPLIFLYKTGYHGDQSWESKWDNWTGSMVVKTLRYCPTKCLFTSDQYLLQSSDLVLVNLAYYNEFGGRPV